MRIRFGPFTLDLESRQLTRAGREIHLEPKAFELLSALSGTDTGNSVGADQQLKLCFVKASNEQIEHPHSHATHQPPS